jgi:tetratricopeptide (TPR) repeat protein
VRALALALLIATTGCAHVPLTCPSRGGPSWREYDSRHFVVFTNLYPFEARTMVGELERTYRSYVDIAGWHFPARGEPPGHLRLVIFASQSDYDALAPAGTDGAFRGETVDGEPLLMISAGSRGHNWHELFLHELTHRLLRFYVGDAPLWLGEGLAEYFSTLGLEDGEAYIGEPPRRVVFARLMLNLRPLLRTQSLAGWSASDSETFYAGAWNLLYVISRSYAHELDGFLLRLAAGEPSDAAFAETFGPHLAELEQRYVQQMHAGALTAVVRHQKYKASPRGTVESERSLNESEVHLLWASTQPPLAKAYLAQVELAEEHAGRSARSEFLRGVRFAAERQLAPAEHAFNAAVALEPSEERYRWAVAALHFDEALDRHLSLDGLDREMRWLAEHGRLRDSIILVARFQAKRGQLVEARATVQRAVDLDGAFPDAWDALSEIGMRQGDVDGAIAAAERALRLAPPTVDMRPTLVRLAKLRELRQQRRERVSSGTHAADPP